MYIRNHSTGRYDLAKAETTYALGILYVLRFGTKWEALKRTLPESKLKDPDPDILVLKQAKAEYAKLQ
jgi:hypothetical protein